MANPISNTPNCRAAFYRRVLIRIGIGAAVGLTLVPSFITQAQPNGDAAATPESLAVEATPSSWKVYLPMAARNMCQPPKLEVEPNNIGSSAQTICARDQWLSGNFAEGPDIFSVFVDQSGTLEITLYVDSAANYSTTLALYDSELRLLTYTVTPESPNIYSLSHRVDLAPANYFIWTTSSVNTDYGLNVEFSSP